MRYLLTANQCGQHCVKHLCRIYKRICKQWHSQEILQRNEPTFCGLILPDLTCKASRHLKIDGNVSLHYYAFLCKKPNGWQEHQLLKNAIPAEQQNSLLWEKYFHQLANKQIYLSWFWTVQLLCCKLILVVAFIDERIISIHQLRCFRI